MISKENNNIETMQEKLSRWQQNMNKRHPFISQFAVNIIVGILLILIGGWLAAINIPANPKAKVITTSDVSAEIRIENYGFIPATNVYEIASGPTVIPSFSIEKGGEYVKLKDTEKKNVKLAIIEGLPKSAVIQINISGSKDITINNE